MKPILITLILLTSLQSFGQFARGNKFIGGTVDFDNRSYPDISNSGNSSGTSISVYPSVGFLLNEKFAVGGQIGFSSYYSKFTNGSTYMAESKSLYISTAIFAKRYFKISDKFLFSLVGTFAFNRGAITNTTTQPLIGLTVEDKSQNYIIYTSITPSFIFFPTPKWGFEVGIGSINHGYNSNLTTSQNSNSFQINYGRLSWGLSYYFRRSDQTIN